MKTDTDSDLKVGTGSSRKTDSNSPFDVARRRCKLSHAFSLAASAVRKFANAIDPYALQISAWL